GASEIHVGDMKDGDVGVITSWVPVEYIGRVVQRYGNYLVTLGAGSESGWHSIFTSPSGLAETDRVRLLEDGEELVMYLNQEGSGR
ncbi:MAG TPA: hypothetical protein VM223_01255, partial [Planctomycetota bacterium]|nr:hypothetical protein [Planctomycetota bacterium]